MKFTDGNWKMRQRVKAFYPAEAYDVETDRNALTVSAARSSNFVKCVLA